MIDHVGIRAMSIVKKPLSATALTLLLLVSGGMITPAWSGEGVRSALPQATQAHRDEGFLQGRNPYYVRFAPGHSNGVEQAVEASGGRVTHRLDIVDSLAVIIPDAVADALARREDVLLVEPVPEHRLAGQVVPYNIDQYQARDVWDKNRDGLIDPGAPDGSSLRFCIIDSGIYASHSDFIGVTMSGFSQIPGEGWDEDEDGHGTHVAGTANAVHNDIGVVGTMPGGAELIILKIFNNNGQWSSGNSNLGEAAIECHDRGANVISMSLGGSSSTTENNIFQALYDNHGILNIAAAGNSGNTSRSFPASYDAVISVGAIDREEVAAEFTQYPATSYDPDNPPANAHWDVVEFAGGGVNVLSTWPGPPTAPHGEVPRFEVEVSGTSYEGNHIEGSGLSEVTGSLVHGGMCDSPGSWNDDVVLCERGEVTFAEKINNVRDGGGVGVLIYNNEPGNFLGTCINPDTGVNQCTEPRIPALSLSQEDGQELFDNELGGSAHLVADSGEGCDGCSGSYFAISGTSMATPGVAAAVGLIWDACGGPAELTPQQIRLLLRESARDLTGVHPGTGFVYGEGWDRVTGWGIPQLLDAQQRGNELYGSLCPIGMQVEPAELEVCGLDETATATFTLDDDFLGVADMSITGVPASASASFDPNPVEHPVKDSVLTLSNLDSVASGIYGMDVTATDTSDPDNSISGFLTMSLSADLPAQPVLSSPANGAAGVELRPTLSWSGAADANEYLLEVATDSEFSAIAYSALVADASQVVSSFLDSATTYYWRVRSSNFCGDGVYSDTYSFTTIAQQCELLTNGSTGAIEDAHPTQGARTTVFTLESGFAGELVKVEVIDLRGSHSWLNDLSFDLVSPSETSVRVMERSCGSSEDFWLSLDDDASGSAGGWPCPPTDQNSFKPSNPLSGFQGEESSGVWELRVTDHERQDTGAVDGWGLHLCVGSGVIDTYEVTAAVSSGNGLIDPASQTVDHDGTASGTYSADPNWSLDSLSGDTCDPESDGAGNWTAENITADCAIEAMFDVVLMDEVFHDAFEAEITE